MLMSNQDVIYSSKNQLFRDCLVFDENGNEIKNNTDYSGVATFYMKDSDNNFYLNSKIVKSEIPFRLAMLYLIFHHY